MARRARVCQGALAAPCMRGRARTAPAVFRRARTTALRVPKTTQTIQNHADAGKNNEPQLQYARCIKRKGGEKCQNRGRYE